MDQSSIDKFNEMYKKNIQDIKLVDDIYIEGGWNALSRDYEKLMNYKKDGPVFLNNKYNINLSLSKAIYHIYE